MEPSASRRLRLAPWVCLAAVLALVGSCHRAPLRGRDFDAGRAAFLHDDYAPPAETAETGPIHRLILIGDAGAPQPDDPTLELLGIWGDAHAERTTVLFLGDNIYPAGLRNDERERDEAILLQQLHATRAAKVFIPGNHDWGFAWNRMYEPRVLANQQAFIEEHADLRADFEPEDGCPGPVALELLTPGDGLAGGLTVLIVDLHWWLLEEDDRPICDGIAGTSDFSARLREELQSRSGQNVIVAAHHPLRSGGPHGGFSRGFWFDLAVGLWYSIFTAQDLIEPGYENMLAVLSKVLSESPPLAMVGGHDHSLQVLDGGDEAELVVVSGAGSKVSSVTPLEETLFAHAHRGFVAFDFYADEDAYGRGVLRIEIVETGRGEESVASFVVDLDVEEAQPQRAPTSPPD